MNELTESQQAAFDAMNAGGWFFLTGSAGTGKSYLIRRFIDAQRQAGRKVLVTASTGVAALNIGGVTCHRAFKIPIKPLAPNEGTEAKLPKTVGNADVVIVDEVSMLRFDVAQFIFEMLFQSVHKKTVIFTGDFYQLPPVIGDKDESALKALWNREELAGGFAFQSTFWKRCNVQTLTLNEIVRQSDKDFSDALEKVRRGDFAGVKWIASNSATAPIDGAISLFATNKKAREVNEAHLKALKGKSFFSEAVFDGEATEKDFNGEKLFKCKRGSRVMSVVNAQDDEGYKNGSLGVVKDFDVDGETVTVDFDEIGEVKIKPYVWEVKDYTLEKGKLKEKTVGEITQIPLKLSDAVTIHKSQGQTFDAVNLSPYAFADGQLYVALSRCKSAGGVYFLESPKKQFLKCSDAVKTFYEGAQ